MYIYIKLSKCMYTFNIFFHFIDNYTSIQLEGKNIQKPLFGHNWNCSFPVFLSHYLFPGTFPLNVLQLGVPQDSTIPVSSKFTVKISPTHAFNYHYYVNDSQILMPFPDIFQVLISVKYLLNISIWPKGHSKILLQSEGLSVSTKNQVLLLSHLPPLLALSYRQSLCIANFSLHFHLHIQSATKCY